MNFPKSFITATKENNALEKDVVSPYFIVVQRDKAFQNNPGGHIWEFDVSLFRSDPKLLFNAAFIR